MDDFDSNNITTTKKSISNNVKDYSELDSKNDSYIISSNTENVSKTKSSSEHVKLSDFISFANLGKGSFSEVYLVQRKNLILFSFTNSTDYNLKIIKIYLFFYSILIFFVINTLFFNDSLIHNLYVNKGNINFKENYLRILGAIIISNVIIFGTQYLLLIESDIIKIKQVTKKEIINKLYTKIIKNIVKRYIIFAVINIILIILSWLYLSCFFVVYKNDQIYLIINLFIGFIFTLIYPFVFCFIPTIIRFISLSDKNRERMYKVSQILQI